jgi:hypothetical protein
MALASCQCVAGLPPWKQIPDIIAAARVWAGESDDKRCYEGRPISEQLAALYCAVYAVASNAPEPPGDIVLDMDAVFAANQEDGVEADVANWIAAWQGTQPFGSGELLGTAPSEAVTFNNYSTPSLYKLRAGGNTYDGTNGAGMLYNLLNPAPAPIDGQWGGIQGNFTGTAQAAQQMLLVAMVRYGDLSDPAVSANINTDPFNLSSAAGFTVPQSVYAAGGYRIIHGHSNASLGNSGPIDITKDYMQVTFHDQTGGLGKYHWVENTSNTVVWSSESVLGGPPGNMAYLLAQTYLNTRRGTIDIPVLGLKWNSPEYPPGNPTIPAISNGTISQNVIDGICRFYVERYESTDGFAVPTVIDSNLLLATAYETDGYAKTFDDTTVVDGVTYRYYIRAKLGTAISAYAPYLEFTVDNGAVAAAGWQFPGAQLEAAFSDSTTVTQSDSSNIRTVSIVVPFTGTIKRIGVKIVDSGGSSGNPWRAEVTDFTRDLMVSGSGTIANGLIEILVADTPVTVGQIINVTVAMLAGGSDVTYYTIPATSGTDVFSGGYFSMPYDPLPNTVDFTEQTMCAGIYLQP